uniref:Integrase, catalytic region, zinc finger, CCHC-type, peptidase aspartic, catalytic n=1 Tax=Tanacetum cinerariifolium TaxID=118510 RepID=A0A699HUN4_TANCI|nr:hypothetical protein [Tanacetum cinerariifolium]
MANLSEDIQCADFDSRPLMLDRTDFASWQQRIRLYCQGKENGVNILKSINEGPFQIGTIREPLAEGTERAPHLGPELPRVYSDLSPEEKDRNIKMTMSRMQLNSKFMNNMLPEWGRFVTAVKLNRGLRDPNYDQLYAYLKQQETHANENKMMLDRFSQHTVDPLALMSNVSHQQHYSSSSSTLPSTYVPPHLADNAHLDSSGGAAGYGGVQNRVGNANPGQARHVKCYNYNEQLLFLVGGQDNAIDDDVDEQPVQDLALTVDNVFQADDCDAFDSDVDEAPTAQTMFMANLSSADPDTDEAGPSMIQTFYLSDSNMIPYDQYVKDNAVPVVHSNVSSVPTADYMMIYNDIFEPHAQSVFNTSRNTVVENSLIAELATYKEQVKVYKRRAKFELTKREQKINEQLRLVIFDRNFKEETLKKELHSIKLQLASTINHNKSMVEEVTFMKKDFKQKENKYLKDFLDMKSLKEKVEDRLFKQDQSLQTVHMLCRPKPYYNELDKVAIGYKNPLCLTRAKQVQPALYNAHEIIKDNHVLAIVYNTEDTLEIAKITKRKMNDKMKDPECVIHKGIQKALTKEIKELKDVFEELEAEVAQNIVDRKLGEIERKNLLIANDNLIAEFLTKEVFSVAMNSELNVARFTEIHVARTIVEARCLELEAELSNLRDKSHNDNPDELVNHFSNLEVDHLNL